MVILQLVVFLLIYGIKGSSTQSLSSSPNTVVTYTCTITNGTAAGLTDWTLPNGTCPTNAFPDKIRLSQFVSGQCSAQVTSTCGPYAAYSIQSSDPTYCLSFILNVTITAAMNGSTVTCYNTNYLNSSITGVVFSATINIVGPVPTPSAPNSPSTPTAPPQNSTPVTPPTSGPPITGSTNDTAAVTTPPASRDTGAIVGGVVGAALIVTIIIIVVIVIVTRCRKCGGGEVNRIASGSRHDNSNTVELLNTTSQSGDVAQERDPNPAESTVVRRVSPGTAVVREGDDHATGRPDEATVIVMKPYVAEIHADCSTEMKCDDMAGPVLETENTDVCVTVAGVQEHADQDKLEEGPKSQCVFSAGSPAPVHPRGEDTGNCEKLSYKAVLLSQPQPHLLYKAGDCATRACVVSEPKKIEQADGEFYPPLKNVPSDHMCIDLENKY